MESAHGALQVLDRHYLEVRCKMLEVAATLDRISRAEGTAGIASDPRLEQVAKALEILASDGDDRAERLQMVFSDPYQAGWNK